MLLDCLRGSGLDRALAVVVDASDAPALVARFPDLAAVLHDGDEEADRALRLAAAAREATAPISHWIEGSSLLRSGMCGAIRIGSSTPSLSMT